MANREVKLTANKPLAEKALGAFFGHPQFSGVINGNIIKLRVTRDGALMQYEDSKDAQIVVAKGKYAWADGTEIYATWATQAKSRPKHTTPDIPMNELRPAGFHATGKLGGSPKKDFIEEEEDSDEESLKPVIIEGLNPSEHKQTIELFFEDRRNGGGAIEDIDLSGLSRGRVSITFEDPAVALRLLKKKALNMEGRKLTVRPGNPAKKAKISTATRTTTIEISNISSETSEEYLNMFFTNKKKSGGGPIDELLYSKREGKATIAFVKPEDAESVLAKGNLELHKHKLSVIALDVNPADSALSGGSCAIVVSGYPPSISSQYLSLYFENRKKSGGGPVEDIYIDSEIPSATITFESHDVVRRVLQKGDHHLESQPLNITELAPAPPVPIVQPPLEENKILLRHLSLNTQPDVLQKYLAPVSGCKIDIIEFSPCNKGVAMVIFAGIPDFNQIREKCHKKPLMGKMFSIQKVPETKCLQVYNFQDMSEESLDLLLDSEEVSESTCEKIRIYKQPFLHAIAHFSHSKAPRKVMKKKPLMFGRIELFTSLYYEGFGLVPPGTPLNSPTSWLKQEVELDPVNQYLLQFILSNKIVKDFFRTEMDRINGIIEWPTSDRPELVVKYNDSKSRRGSSIMTKDWKQLVPKTFNGTLGNFDVAEVNTLQEVWAAFVKQLSSARYDPEKILIEKNNSSCTVIITGFKKDVIKVAKDLRATATDLEEQLQRKNKITRDIVNNLKKHQILILRGVCFHEQLKRTFKDFQVTYDVSKCSLTFTGLPNDISKAKVQMYEIMNSIVNKKMQLSQIKLQLLNSEGLRDYFTKVFTKNSIIASWEVQHDHVVIYATGNNELDTTCDIIKQHLIEKTVPLSESTRPLVNSEKWFKFQKEVETHTKGTAIVTSAKSVITACGIKEKVDAILQDIHGFLQDNAMYEKFVEMPPGMTRLVLQHMSVNLERIKSQINHSSLKFVSCFKKMPTGFTIKGTLDTCNKAATALQNLGKDIMCAEHKISQPGMVAFFTQKQGKEFLDALEMRNKVTIDILDDAPQDLLHSVTKASKHDQPVLKSKMRASNYTIFITKADLPTFSCDAIVNAANKDLEHSAGLAGDIVKLGGQEIQSECRNRIRALGTLLPGQVFVSGAGKLNCRKIIHAVGPIWKGGGENEENTLYEVVYEVLNTSTTRQFHSIAMPAISTGIYGFPMKGALRIIIDAVADFFKADATNDSPSEVYLVDNSDKIVHDMQQTLFDKFGAGNVTILDRASTKRRTPKAARSSGIGMLDPLAPVRGNVSISGDIVTTAAGVTIKMKIGELSKEKSDVIVNTTSSNLKLNSGAVSASLLKAGGQILQDECNKKAPSGIKAGDIVITSGGNLKCKFVYHGHCVSWDGPLGTSPKVFCQFVQNCLSAADKASMTSISFPAIGTGNLRIPHDYVARTMYEEVIRFGDANQSTLLKSVRFVIYPKDDTSIKAFKSEIDSRGQSTAAGGAGRTRKLKTLDSTEDDYAARPKRPLPRTPSIDNPTGNDGVVFGKPSRNRYNELEISVMNKCTIQILQGDLIKEQVDVIVNGSDSDLSLNGAVGKALTRAAGAQFKQECKRIGKISDLVLFTTSGNLRCKEVLHVDIHKLTSGYGAFSSSSDGWKKTIYACLEKADLRGHISIAFPALGTGNMGHTAEAITEVFMDAISEFCSSGANENLLTIRIVIFDSDMSKTFQDCMEKLAVTSKPKGFFSNLKDKLWGKGEREGGARVEEFEVLDEEEPIPLPNRSVHDTRTSITFQIYGSSQKSINTVTSRIDQICEDESQDIVMDSEKDQDHIAKLSQAQMDRIKGLEDRYQVKITMKKGVRMNRIRIQGFTRDALMAKEKIHQIFRETEDREVANIIAQQVKWEYKEDDKFVPYPEDINALLEKAYKNKKPHAEWAEPEGTTTVHFRVKFDDLTEVRQGSSGQPVKVRRFVPDAIAVPATWDTMESKDIFKEVPLNTSSIEYNDIYSKFMKETGSSLTVIEISRIQNPSLYQRVRIHEKHMKKYSPGKTSISRNLWHGTSVETCAQINTNGFNRSYCGKNATYFGRGVYFARDAQYSCRDTYSRPDSNNRKYVYYCTVLTGDITRGNEAYVAAPPKDPQNPHILYDAVVDNVNNPCVFVIFSDTQAYPDYLIKFK